MATHPRRTRVLSIDPAEPNPAALDEAAAILRGGGLVAFPTETVYGLGADAANPAAVARVYEAKGRPPGNPLIVHADGLALARFCALDPDRWIDTLGPVFWPGPLTLVLRKAPWVPDLVTAGRPTVGVRVPSPPIARGLIARLGRPIAAPSANRSTAISPTCAEHVLHDLEGRVELVLDGGPTAIGLESTVLDLTREPPRILRPGPVTAHDLAKRAGLVVAGERGDPDTAPERNSFASPGQMPLHYAPRTPTVWVEPDALPAFPWPRACGLLILGEHALTGIPSSVRTIELKSCAEAMRRLYAALHELDRLGLARLVVVPPPRLPEWEALRDRLSRAAQSRFPPPS